MSANSSKIAIGLILGLVVGIAGGYFYFNPKIDHSSNILSDLNKIIEDSESSIQDITSEFTELFDDHETLIDELAELANEKNSIEEDYRELESSYTELLDDYEILVASLPLIPQQMSGTTLEREYEWYFEGKTYDLSLSIPESQYNYYKGLERIYQADYSVYVTHPYDDEFINTINRKFNLIALEENLTEEQKINLIISFVQNLPYTVDNVTTIYDEYPRYPLETLIDNGGDCEDSSILTASLLNSMNYDVILINPPGHMAVGVNLETDGSYWEYDGNPYYYIETTAGGWKIGDLPEEYQESTAYLYALNPIPMCLHNWTASWKGSDQMEITIEIENLGSALAEDYKVYASFDAGEDYVWNPVESDFFDLNIGKSLSFTLTLDVPKNENTRLIVHILDSEGYAIDTSNSEWFDT
jgi:hypothetical protein